MPEDRPQSFRFGDFVLDPGRGTLQRAGEDIGLRPQTFAVLSMLAARRGELVSKDELLQSVWHGASVTDDSLTQCIVEIRRAIGDESRTIIRTVPRRGFIFDPPDATTTGHSAGESTGTPGSRSTNRGTWIALAAIAVAAVGIAVFRPTTPDAVDPIIDDLQKAVRPNSIAVLPFVDMSDSQDQQYFADGIAEEILIRLNEYPDLAVIARTSSFLFRDRPAAATTIGRRLNAAYVLEGSVRKAGGTVRISAQLIETRGGTQLWSQSFDSELMVEDLLDIQTAVASSVAGAIAEGASPDGRRTAKVRGTANTEAYDLYLEGMFYLNQIRSAERAEYAQEAYDVAIQKFEAAIDLDPGWALPHAALGRTMHFRAGTLENNEDAEAWEWYRLAREQLLEAIRLDPDFGQAYSALGHVLLHQQDFDFEAAESAYTRARALGDYFPWGYAIFLVKTRQFDEAIKEYRLAIEFDPMSVGPRHQLATVYRLAGRFEDSIAELEKVLQLAPGRQDLHVPLANLYLKTGRTDEGRALFQEFADPESPSIEYGWIYVLLGMKDKAYAAVEAAVADERWWLEDVVRTALVLGEEDRALAYLASAAADDPRWLLNVAAIDYIQALADEPGFIELLRNAGFPERVVSRIR
jgi:TolB-like protein/DNA-binding winged helix-turn-helix (wHTH) protein/Tfp pilus assembly protein PilF